MQHQIPDRTPYTRTEVEGLTPLAIHKLCYRPETEAGQGGNLVPKEHFWI